MTSRIMIGWASRDERHESEHGRLETKGAAGIGPQDLAGQPAEHGSRRIGVAAAEGRIVSTAGLELECRGHELPRRFGSS